MDVTVFRGATAVIGLHACVDAFVVPEPGTGARDHLGRGLVTLGLLALSAAAYPSLRQGGRAALAGVFGVLAAVGGGLAIADTRAGGVRGEDWSGFALVGVGPVLVALALTLLWRSRKAGRLRWLRRGGLVVGATVGAYWLVAPIAVALVATHRPRADVQPAALGRPYERVVITTRDGLKLAAWYVRSRNGAAVVSYPTRQGKLPQARMLTRHGYGVLLLDARGYDGSQGDPNAFGWDGAKDVDAGVAWLRRQPDVRQGRIGGIGFSVGGEVMLQAAANNPALRAVVSEGAGSRSFREELLYGSRGWSSLPEALVQTGALAVLAWQPPPPSLRDVVAAVAPRKVFLIYAGRGGGGEDLNPSYAAAARAPVLLWRVPEARHVGALQARPREYEQRVVAFFDRALLAAAVR